MTFPKHLLQTLILGLTAFIFVACQPVPGTSSPPSPSPTAAQPTAQPTATATPSPLPTVTPSPEPSPTPSSSATPMPTPTPTAVPTPSATPVPTASPVAALEFARIRTIAGNGQTSLAESGTSIETGSTQNNIGFSRTISDVDADKDGNLWILDRSNGRLAYITPEIERPNSAGFDIRYRLYWVRSEELMDPSAMVRDEAGNFYIVESSFHRIVKLDKEFNRTIIAGTGQQGYNGDRSATEAHLNRPSDIAIDAAGNLYISDTGNHLIRKITPEGQLRTLAGQYILDTKKEDEEDEDEVPSFLPIGATTGDGGSAFAARVDTPTYLAVDGQGAVYFSSASNTIRRIYQDRIERYAGSGIFGFNGEDDVRKDLAHMNIPTDLAMGSDGLLYFVDSRNYRIRRVNAAGFVETVAGNGREGDYLESSADLRATEFNATTLTFDMQGNFYFFDASHIRLRMGENAQLTN
jgi:sugar lactone lactonase YvrE